jgi:hypothetical protein
MGLEDDSIIREKEEMNASGRFFSCGCIERTNTEGTGEEQGSEDGTGELKSSDEGREAFESDVVISARQ